MKFKVGDAVRVVDVSDEFYECIGIVTKVDNDAFPYEVKFIGSINLEWEYYCDRDLQPVEVVVIEDECDSEVDAEEAATYMVCYGESDTPMAQYGDYLAAYTYAEDVARNDNEVTRVYKLVATFQPVPTVSVTTYK